MKLWKKILTSIVVVVFVGGGAGYGYYSYKNTPPQLVEPNYFDYYRTQDTKPVGKVGIFISYLIMPEDFRAEDFEILGVKSTQYMPWPIRDMIKTADDGVLLLDTKRFYEFEEFTPTHLIDHKGSNTDIDGVPYMEKYNEGEIQWVDPNPRLHLDHGYFLYPGRKAGMANLSQKLSVKAKAYYYAPGAGFVRGKLPHEQGNWEIVSPVLERIQAKYGDIPWKWVTADNFTLARKALFELMDEGVDTIVFAPPRPIYSHHEEFNGGIKHTMHYIHEWQEENDDHREIKFIITQQLGDIPAIYNLYPPMVRDTLDKLPADSSVKVVVSTHGMAWDRVPHEGWIQLYPPYVDGTMDAVKKTLAQYNFSRTEIVQAQDHFADPINNPNGEYLSTNQAFFDGIEAGFDYVINVPIEFYAENTDTMFSHAMYNFEHFDDFDIYEPVDYPDWSVPYQRSFMQGGTKVIYNGVPVGKYNKPIREAFFIALDSILSQGLEPVDRWQQKLEALSAQEEKVIDEQDRAALDAAINPALADEASSAETE